MRKLLVIGASALLLMGANNFLTTGIVSATGQALPGTKQNVPNPPSLPSNQQVTATEFNTVTGALNDISTFLRPMVGLLDGGLTPASNPAYIFTADAGFLGTALATSVAADAGFFGTVNGTTASVDAGYFGASTTLGTSTSFMVAADGGTVGTWQVLGSTVIGAGSSVSNIGVGTCNLASGTCNAVVAGATGNSLCFANIGGQFARDAGSVSCHVQADAGSASVFCQDAADTIDPATGPIGIACFN